MFKDSNLENIVKKQSLFAWLSGGLLKLGGFVELLVILAVWYLLFIDRQLVGGYTEAEIITYIIGGSLISLFSSWLTQRMIKQDIRGQGSRVSELKPARYLLYILKHGWAKALLPFLTAIILHGLIILFFSKQFIVNLQAGVLPIILLMVILSFIIEFFISYLFQLNVFWTIDSENMYRLLQRIKKLLSGSYFPLNILPPLVAQISLFLPFAYSFYVPAQIYLGRLGYELAVRGIVVQLIWIILLYIAAKVFWVRGSVVSGQG